MNTEIKTPADCISKEKLLVAVRGMMDSEPKCQPNPPPIPRGRWDAIIRAAVLHTLDVCDLKPRLNPPPIPGKPEPILASFMGATGNFRLDFFAQFRPALYDLIGGPFDRFGRAALNPQPLPPRQFFLKSLVEQVSARAEMMLDFSGGSDGEERGIIIVSGYVRRFVDDLCPEPRRIRWPFPTPPPWWFAEVLSGLDLIILASEFERVALDSYSEGLRGTFNAGRDKLAEVGSSIL